MTAQSGVPGHKENRTVSNLLAESDDKKEISLATFDTSKRGNQNNVSVDAIEHGGSGALQE